MTQDENEFAIPDPSFPEGMSLTPGSIAGAHPKLPLVSWHGHLYPEGATPPERYVRFRYCEELASWLAGKCLRNELRKYAGLGDGDPVRRRREILTQYRTRMLSTRARDFELVLSPTEVDWVITKTAETLSWPLPGRLPADGHKPGRQRPKN